MRVLDLFSGIGGFALGFHMAGGYETVGFVEIDPFCQKVLKKHWPDVPVFSDIRTFRGDEVGAVDVVCGGFPCQPHSLAGKRKGSADERDMWPEFARVIRAVKPRWVVAENVKGLLSSDDGRYFGGVLRDLAASGYDSEWTVLPAYVARAPQTRARVYIVAYTESVYGQAWGVLEKGGVWTTQAQPRGLRGLFGGPEPTVWADEPKPRMGRVAHGVPSRVDRLRSLGNAVVPQVICWLARRIKEVSA